LIFSIAAIVVFRITLSICDTSKALLAGMFFVGVQLLQKYGYVGPVNWDKVGNDTSMQIQHWVANVDVTNVHSIFHMLGIPVTGGLGLAFFAGFVRTR
jgi:uncharacterized membrane protein (Fun14 family)